MMKYEETRIEIITFEAEDIITNSNLTNGGTSGGMGEEFLPDDMDI